MRVVATQRAHTVGVLAPMPSEMQPVVKAMSLVRDTDARTYRGNAGAFSVVAARTGIGMARAGAATERLLDDHGVDRVVVVGIAGGLGASEVGDVVIPEVVVDKATGEEFRATLPASRVARGRLASHDDFALSDDDRRALVANGFVAIDMETAAIAAVCAARATPWFAVRAISDLAGVTPDDVIDLANSDGSPNMRASLRYLVTKPQRIPRLVKLAFDARRAAQSAARTAAACIREIDTT